MNAFIVFFIFTYGVYALFNNLMFWFIYILLVGIYFFITQFKYFKSIYNSIRRKLIVATWGTNNDCQIYSKVKIDITKMQDYLNKKSEEAGEKITLTIYAIKLLALIINKYPNLNSYIKFGKVNEKKGVDICCLVQIADGEDLANTVIRNAEKKNFKEIINDLKANVKKYRTKTDDNHNKRMKIIDILPTFIISILLQVASFLGSIGVTIDILGVKKFEFGSATITSVGSIGLEDAFAPIPRIYFLNF
jgi:hypothetical protein